jgi:hypothetical protein
MSARTSTAPYLLKKVTVPPDPKGPEPGWDGLTRHKVQVGRAGPGGAPGVDRQVAGRRGVGDHHNDRDRGGPGRQARERSGSAPHPASPWKRRPPGQGVQHPVGAIPVNPTIGTIGVTETEAAETVDVPTALLAETGNVYAVPLDNPVTVPVAANQETHAVFPPGQEVIVYLVIAEPP